MTKNVIYPCGENYTSFLEYQVHCPTCGEIIYYFLPENEKVNTYIFNSITCHPFIKSINRGYPHKMIRLREDMMGGGYIDDFYNLYPIIKNESIEDRKARLIQIKLDDLKDKMVDNLSKKKWLIQTLVNKNETILNALDPVIQVYEKTPKENWNQLDKKLEEVDEKYSAVQLISKFNLKVSYSSATINTQPIGDINSFMTSNPMSSVKPTGNQWKCPSCGAIASGVFCMECGTKKPLEWTCSCGTVNKGKFCTECGKPKQ